MSSSFERYLRRLRDPRWIPHISSYCDVRCHRCPFNTRCWSFAVLQGLEPDSPEDVEPAEPEFEPQTPRRPGWAEVHHVDVDDSEMTVDEEKAYDARAQRMENDPLARHASSYASDVSEILLPLLKECSQDVTEAMHDVYSWSLTIAAKTHRAIGSLEFNKDEEIEIDAVQNDANGSAKVVLVAIEQSMAAWSTMAQAGVLDSGLVKYLADELVFLENELRERFPFAMAFVRPGFDEEVPGVVRPWKLDPHEDENEDEE
jgi:hypothetical protein